MSCIVKDTDTPITITLCDQDENPINLDNVSGLIIEVFQKDIPFDQFSKVAQAGFRDIIIVDASNGVLKIVLNAANTCDGVPGMDIFYEAKVESVNVEFDGGTQEVSTGAVKLATLSETQLKDGTFN